MTKQEIIVQRLINQNVLEIRITATKARVLRVPNTRADYFVYVGRNGSLRLGNAQQATSIAMNVDRFVEGLASRQASW